jgi:hypothetical protein
MSGLKSDGFDVGKKEEKVFFYRRRDEFEFSS